MVTATEAIVRITRETFYKFSERSKRISIDIDGHHIKEEPLKLLRIYFALAHLFPNAKTSAQKTFHGYHVKTVGEDIEKISIAKRVEIRKNLGDDSERIDYDELKLRWHLEHYADTLFTTKRYMGWKTLPWANQTTAKKRFRWQNRKIKVTEFNPLALPWISKLPAKKPISQHQQ